MPKSLCGGNAGTGMHVQGFGRRIDDEIVSVTVIPIEKPRPEPNQVDTDESSVPGIYSLLK